MFRLNRFHEYYFIIDFPLCSCNIHLIFTYVVYSIGALRKKVQNMNEIKNEQTEQPKVIYVERKKKPFPWKTIGKYALCCLLSGLCGFGGGLFANYVDRQKTNNDIQ